MYEISERHFSCKRDTLSIRGMEFCPVSTRTGEKYPAVILSHGFTGNYTDVISFCRRFAAEGYAAFCFSFCGGGRNNQDPETLSDGDPREMSLFSETEDLLCVMDYVKTRAYVMSDQLILVGFSQGGFVSGLAAARRPEEVSRLIMVYPALCIPDHARRGRLGGAHYDVSAVPEEIPCRVTVLGRSFHEEAFRMDSYLELAPYKGPVLILQGTEDPVVNYSYAIRAKENYEPGQCRLQLIQRMGHGQNQKQEESMFASMRQFLADREEILTIHVLITQTDETAVSTLAGEMTRAAGRSTKEAAQEDGRLEGEAAQADSKLAGEVAWTAGTAAKLTRRNVYFTGYCDTGYFKGVILPGGCDCQEYMDDRLTKLRAEYTLYGLDPAGKTCHLHIINSQGEKDFRPIISTDSQTLAWLNTADLTAVLEDGEGGVVVRIYYTSGLATS